jgi:hypothetical protein
MSNNNRPTIGLPQKGGPSTQQPAPAPSIDDRIAVLRSEIDALVDAKVQAIAADCPGIPSGVLRNMLIGNNAGCQCSQYLALASQ